VGSRAALYEAFTFFTLAVACYVALYDEKPLAGWLVDWLSASYLFEGAALMLIFGWEGVFVWDRSEWRGHVSLMPFVFMFIGAVAAFAVLRGVASPLTAVAFIAFTIGRILVAFVRRPTPRQRRAAEERFGCAFMLFLASAVVLLALVFLAGSSGGAAFAWGTIYCFLLAVAELYLASRGRRYGFVRVRDRVFWVIAERPRLVEAERAAL
jgi:hypothetical protein